MISSVSSLFDKNFVIGFLLPALVATVAAAFAFPELDILKPLTNLQLKDKDFGDLTYLVLGVSVFALLLMAGNYAIYRALEGYTPPLRWMPWLRAGQVRAFAKLKSRHDTLMAEWRAAADNGRTFSEAEQAEVSRLKYRWVRCFPASEAELLPTRFGNVLKAFEVYPREVHGADSIALWPRLLSVVPKDYLTLIDEAHAQVDCFVNLTVLAAAVFLVALAQLGGDAAEAGRQILAGHGWTGFANAFDPRHLVVTVLSLAASMAAYRWATGLAINWGETVKGAFDCYLPALAQQFGYALPAKEAQRRAFWVEINALLTYQQPLSPDRWPRLKADKG